MRKFLADRSFRLTFVITLLFFGTGIAFLLLGLAPYGSMLFVVLPIVLGVALGAMPNKRYTLWGALLATVLTLLGLYVPGLSGLLCIVMVLPIIVPLVFLGYVVAHLAARNQGLREPDRLPVRLAPLLLFVVGAPAEQYATHDEPAVTAVVTERVYPYSPEQVYDAIKSVDTLDAPKPFLMNFDLPIPVKCVLEKEAVGGRCTCYFKAGLRPRAYWEPLAKLGIRQEHDYVFDNLARDLRQQYGRH